MAKLKQYFSVILRNLHPDQFMRGRLGFPTSVSHWADSFQSVYRPTIKAAGGDSFGDVWPTVRSRRRFFGPFDERRRRTGEGEQNWADEIKEGGGGKKQQGSIEWKLMVHIILSAFLLFKEQRREENALKWCLLYGGGGSKNEEEAKRGMKGRRGGERL